MGKEGRPERRNTAGTLWSLLSLRMILKKNCLRLFACLLGGSLSLTLSACSENAEEEVHEGHLVQVLPLNPEEESKFYLTQGGNWISLQLEEAPTLEPNQDVTIRGSLSGDGRSL